MRTVRNKIGFFYPAHHLAVSAYRKHSQSLINASREYGTVACNPTEMKIVVDNYEYRYFAMTDMESVYRIAGLEFDAIFTEVVDPEIAHYILTRFRPRCKCH